ncbi:MAG: phosphohistidine phosphatase SixA [Pseudomonas sp.]|uniref:phosphohistidine phosphatase SixA n=1 Tax=Pseudomonas sp. TaxID=306 RepID=UPI003BB80F87
MKLWLLRHGEAEPQARSDAARELTRHGRKEVLHSAAHLVGRPLTAILASPYVRAQQTAQLVRETLGFAAPIVTVPWLTPDGDLAEALRYLDAQGDQELLLVTHQPLVGELASLLLHGHRQEPVPMKTASLAELDGEFALAGSMWLTSLRHS